ncbi:hypothetical protein CONCODRAFT_9999 [Conidiobolus coronatus NRRL 28638]|uniref:Uncharacterized protein n=1 Tax=Conidiobolus coronatus (strain ATCC 28846 / CBS 209.66 / NRRL 28638) TaxID=796925 RepID=A0A137NYH6_CONC2|nr:hypothetical protein CONCODRAFT_9999 [Conidiobolus coronatus NRRL 28638]|eukprot:KXN67865.1 hypothetical protein CONCODRAFT_9999 [Conidiobolus coronatus NRRL 28638]
MRYLLIKSALLTSLIFANEFKSDYFNPCRPESSGVWTGDAWWCKTRLRRCMEGDWETFKGFEYDVDKNEVKLPKGETVAIKEQYPWIKVFENGGSLDRVFSANTLEIYIENLTTTGVWKIEKIGCV